MAKLKSFHLALSSECPFVEDQVHERVAVASNMPLLALIELLIELRNAVLIDDAR